MASVLALQRIFPHNGSLLGRLASRRLREERKLLERPGRITRGNVRYQSTQTSTQVPQSRQPKRRSKKASTIDIIQVKDECVSEQRTKVTRLNSLSLEQTLGSVSTATIVTEPKLGSHSDGNLFEEVSLDKFSDLINSHLEKSLRYPSICEAVRWNEGVTHTYDESFASGAFETCDNRLRDGAVDEELVCERSRLEVEEVLGLSEMDLSSLLSSHPSSGLTSLQPLSVEPEDVAEKGGAQNNPKKSGAGGKKSSNNKKKIGKVTSSKKKPTSGAKKSKAQKGAVMTETNTTILNNEQTPEEDDMFIDRDSYKKLTREEVSAAQTEDLCSTEEGLVPAAEGSPGINVGMLNRATHTLLYYRRLSKYTNGMRVSSIGPFRILLQGHAEKGNFNKMEELLRCMQEEKIPADQAVYGALLSCLGRQLESFNNTRNIQGVLTSMMREGIKLQQVFSDVDFIRDGYECALRAVQRVSPSFKPQQRPTPVHYACNLVSSLNNDMFSNQVPSPARDLATSSSLHKWAEEQFACELSSEITIESIQNKDVTDEVHFHRKKLEAWESRWREVLYRTFVDQVDAMKQSFFSNRQDKRMSLYPYLVTLPADDFVNVMMQEIGRLAGGSEAFSPSRYVLYRRLGELVFNRYSVQYKKEVGVMDKLKQVYKDYCDWYINSQCRDGISYIPRVSWSEFASRYSEGPRLDHSPVEWPNTVQLALGQFLYSMLLTKVMVWKPLHSEKHTYPALYEVERSYGFRVVEEIKPSPTLLDLYRKASKTSLTFEAFVAPMVSPPIPWVSMKLGGYLLTDAKIVRLPYNAHQQKQRMVEKGNQQLFPVMDSLNQLGSIPWMVNKPMLDLLIEVFNNKGSDELDVPPPPSEHPVPPKIQPNMTNAEIHQIRRQRMDYYKKKSEMHSLWCDALYKLSLANHFRDRIFWFPHNMDFRGRVYPCPPHLNHLSSDVFRSILQFARGEKLGPNGLRWLKLHLINLTGIVKKKSIEKRLEYCEDILEDILDSADQPLTGKRWWTKSDEPWQTLAACKELAAALRSPDPHEFVSHLPIHQDGSCNGLQHYAALGRDEVGAVSVNLASSHTPQDVYSAVAVLVEEERKKDAEMGKEIAKVLEGFVRRKVIKQTVMTTVYGVTRYGARLQIEKQLKALDDFPMDQRWAASQYLVHKTFHSLEKMFTATKEIQDWFTECARVIAQTRSENIEWVTPLGFPVVQPYSKTSGNKICMEKLPSSYSMDSFMRPNVMKQKNAFPPNFIHSLDSSHMMLTSLFCQQAGITFVSVHDCFWTHANTVDIMNKVCRNQFVALHSEPILEDLSLFLQEKFGYDRRDFAHDGSASDSSKMRLNNLLGKVPPKGDFDISNVLRSTFFFS
ncbi:DNA-directed RNA polymerase, mitochondrial [Penaeus vannamei]|uniref:DNA-directed RNA polymerase n=1 Tax=Penaeus vannamei TaxID=6689 RepID=A0A423TRD1_PENVA|nr:DNA-directed RNA polymerase, mitochondrial [Penaeus vannamei]